MEFDADLSACAAIIERADPLRFRASMAAPVAARRVLFPLYAFNIEVARAPWVTQETMIAEMRLQWWRDVCDEIANRGVVRRHDVLDEPAFLDEGVVPGVALNDVDVEELVHHAADVRHPAIAMDLRPSSFDSSRPLCELTVFD